jgi:hypothetical protein
MTRTTSRHRFSQVALLAMMASAVGSAGADSLDGFVVQDPHYGEVLFHFYQQDQFTALTHLVTARSQNRVESHKDDAELLQGGLLLSWGQHDEAGRIFERLLDTTEDTSVRNRTWFYLAKVRYQRGHLEAAERAFDSISEALPPELEAERYNLQARLYMDSGRYAEAVALLNNWQGDDAWTAYANYNTGVALIRMDQLAMGATLLNRVGTMPAGTDELRSLRDQANVALGFSYLQAQLDGDARPVLQRVRLNGPFSNKALLGVGWADSANQRYQAALGPWLELSQRDLLDSAVQESLLAVPYAFAQLGAEPQAAAHYSRALDIFGAQLTRLDNALVDAGTGRLLDSLLENESGSMGGWYWQLDSLPDDDRTRYLYFAIADHRFHEGLKSYRDLVALSTHLTEWRDKLGAYRDMLATRELAYAERLPVLEEKVARFDLPGMLTQQELNTQRTRQARETRDIVAVAPAAEQDQWRRLLSMESAPAWESQAATGLQEKQRILKGVLLWNMDKEYRVRMWRQEKENAALAGELELADEQFAAIEHATESLPGTLLEFENRIDVLEASIVQLQARLSVSMEQYANYLNDIATEELVAQRERLLTYRAQARFSLASVYDRIAAQNR